MRSFITILLSALTAISAAPIEERQAPFEITLQSPWNAGAVNEFQIHSSCNASEQYQLRRGLAETIELAQHAKDHILRWGNESDIYRKYFGNRPTVEAIGSFDIIINGDKRHALFRCDNPDGNCDIPTYGGHWRGTNATEETVICPLSFSQRRWLATLCGNGYNVRQHSRLLFWASDLLHRLYHVPVFGQGYIDHYADGYEGIVGNASSPNSTHDSDGLQYFALEAYAFDIIVPGAGCPGPAGSLPATSSSSSTVAASSASSVSSAAATATTTTASSSVTGMSSSAASSGATATSSALPENCHFHSDGSVHCT